MDAAVLITPCIRHRSAWRFRNMSDSGLIRPRRAVRVRASCVRWCYRPAQPSGVQSVQRPCYKGVKKTVSTPV